MTDTAHLDYVRFACWDDTTALKLMAQIRRDNPGKFRKAKWLQYDGWRSRSMFYGIGEQSKRRHYVFEQSGEDSNYLGTLALKIPKLYCTRLDIQVTIEEPQEFEPFAAYAEQKRISKRSSSLIHSDTGSTIYIGSRQGETFARLYQKRYDENRFLRLEFEVKGKAAKAVWQQLAEGITVNDMYAHYLSKIKLPEDIKTWFQLDDTEDIAFEIIRIVHADKQLEWLSSLEATIIRMGNDDYQGNTVRGLLDRWTALIDKQDITL